MRPAAVAACLSVFDSDAAAMAPACESLVIHLHRDSPRAWKFRASRKKAVYSVASEFLGCAFFDATLPLCIFPVSCAGVEITFLSTCTHAAQRSQGASQAHWQVRQEHCCALPKKCARKNWACLHTEGAHGKLLLGLRNLQLLRVHPLVERHLRQSLPWPPITHQRRPSTTRGTGRHPLPDQTPSMERTPLRASANRRLRSPARAPRR